MADNSVSGNTLLWSSLFVFACHAMRRWVRRVGEEGGDDSCGMTTMMKSSFRRRGGSVRRVFDLKLAVLGGDILPSAMMGMPSERHTSLSFGQVTQPSEKVSELEESLLRAIALRRALVCLNGDVMKKKFLPFGLTRALRGLYSVGSAMSKFFTSS